MKLLGTRESIPRIGGMTRHDWKITEFLRLGGRTIPAKLAAESDL